MIVNPQCCPYAQRFITLVYAEYYSEDKEHFNETKPFWVVRGSKMSDEELTDNLREEKYPSNVEMQIYQCPSCGLHLPAIRKKDKPPEKVMTMTDGGYYCDTCKERLMCCECARPEELLEIAHD